MDQPEVPMAESELQNLVRKAQEGDSEAFSRVYDQFFAQVFRYCAFRLEKEEAEDAVADIFVKAWEKLHTYKIQRGVPFAAWLFRIARHAVIDTYRTRRGFEEIPENLEDQDAFSRADFHTQRNDLLRIVRAALEKLPRRYREILTLTYIAGLPHSEVARVLRMTEGGVRILKLRALRKLETLLPPDSQSAA